MTDKMHHGHVRERTDKTQQPCGGPAICLECSAELAQFGMQEISILRKQLVQWQIAVGPCDKARIELIGEVTRLKAENEHLLRRVGAFEQSI